jgi:thiamine biosynthesis lipoprotein
MTTPSRPTRRQFLKGRATDARLDGPEGVPPPAGEPGATRPAGDSLAPPLLVEKSSLVVSVCRRAMACDFEAQLAAGRKDDSMQHVFAALDLVEAIEGQLTVYRNESEVIGVNRLAAEQPVEVEPRLFALLRLAERLCRETGGALDITAGPLSEAWGFSRRQGRLPSDAEITTALQCVGMDHVVLDETQRTVAFRRPGVSVNFNSIGKGYALDRMAELLADNGVDDYLLHGGRSSVLARGTRPGMDGVGWPIGLRHPLRPTERLAEFYLRDQALATSGSATQFFRHQGRQYGHILDPRTGRPAEGVYSATVIAPSAAEADALSTAFYVMGPDAVEQYCAGRPEISAILVFPARREGAVEVVAVGLDDDQWRRLARD